MTLQMLIKYDMEIIKIILKCLHEMSQRARGKYRLNEKDGAFALMHKRLFFLRNKSLRFNVLVNIRFMVELTRYYRRMGELLETGGSYEEILKILELLDKECRIEIAENKKAWPEHLLEKLITLSDSISATSGIVETRKLMQR